MRLGSLCTGVGGLDLAIGAHLPCEHTWHAETDPAASKVLAAHWPSVPNLGDITAVNWSSTEPVDVLTGGIPCQGWSNAGKRRGADDDRDLWPVRKHEPDGTIRRGAVDAIRALRPKLFVLENVPGLLTGDGGAAFGTVLADLDALGYTISWTVVGACRVGACHHRHRLFLAATTVDVDPPDGALFGLPLAAAGKWPSAGFVRGGLAWEMPASTCGTAGAAVLPTPTVADSRGSRNATAGRTTTTTFDAGWTLSDMVYAGRIGDLALPSAVQPERFGAYEAAVRRQEQRLGHAAPEPTEPGRLGKPRLTAAFPEWMMGFAAGWITAHVGRADAIRCGGNGVMPQQGAYALGLLPTVRAVSAALLEAVA